MIRTQLILAYVLCATSLILAQQTGGRTDVFYDSGRNVVFAIASSAPDYNTQYYYRMPMTTYLTKKGLTQSLDAWGYGTGESGPGTTYTEAPAESGVEFTAMTYHKVAIEYQTYEVVPGCGSCNDWYDPYGYLSIASKGDPEDDGPTFSIWVWATWRQAAPSGTNG